MAAKCFYLDYFPPPFICLVWLKIESFFKFCRMTDGQVPA